MGGGCCEEKCSLVVVLVFNICFFSDFAPNNEMSPYVPIL